MKILLLLTALCVLVSASYQKAQEYYTNQDYSNAIKEAKISFDEYSNPNLHLVWAKSAEALGNTQEAMNAYERVTLLDVNNIESRIALVKIYEKTQRDDLARDMSKELQNYQLTPEQRSSLDLLKGTNINSIKAKATLGVGYDSNINVNPGGSALDDYYGTIGNDGTIDTLFSRLTGSLTYINELESKGGLYVKGDARIYYQNNSDAHYYDMLMGSLEAGVGYAGDDYTLYLPLVYDRMKYLDRDLLQIVRIDPRVNVTLTNEYILNLNARYAKRTYIDSVDKNRDDSTVGVGAGLYYLFDKNFAYANIKYEKFSAANNSVLKFVDKSMFTASFGVNYNLTSWLVTRVDYRYRMGSYDDNIGTFLTPNKSKRSDDYNQIEIKLSHYFMENFEAYISDRYSKNSSNYAPAEYNKNVIIFGLGLNY